MIRTFSVFFTCILFISCTFEKEHGFYYGSWYLPSIHRLPLIDPYELNSMDGEIPVQWTIQFYTHSIIDNIPAWVSLVGIKDSCIVLFSDTQMTRREPAWYIIDTRKKTEKQFFNYNEYKKELILKHIETIKWYRIDSAYYYFDKNGLYPPGWPRKSAYDTVSKNDSS